MTAKSHPRWTDWECTRDLQPAPTSYVRNPPTRTPSKSTIVSSPTSNFRTTFVHWNRSHTISSTQIARNITPTLPVTHSPRILQAVRTSLLTKKPETPHPHISCTPVFFHFFFPVGLFSLNFLWQTHSVQFNISVIKGNRVFKVRSPANSTSTLPPVTLSTFSPSLLSTRNSSV